MVEAPAPTRDRAGLAGEQVGDLSGCAVPAAAQSTTEGDRCSDAVPVDDRRKLRR
jgi:hypothetical protein